MKLSILVDNNSYVGEYFLAEPALSFLIEDGDFRLLFDTGYSDAFIRNAKAMGIDLRQLDAIVISHGHEDHTRGLEYLAQLGDFQETPLYAHPLAFNKKDYQGQDAGSLLSADQVTGLFDLRWEKAPLALSEHLTYLGEIPLLLDFEPRQVIGDIEIEGLWQKDYGYDDTALVYDHGLSLTVITGCAHAGLCNTIEYAQQVLKKKVKRVIGGFHLLEVDDRLKATVDYLMDNHIEELYPSHCVSFPARAYMHARTPIRDTWTSMRLAFD